VGPVGATGPIGETPNIDSKQDELGVGNPELVHSKILTETNIVRSLVAGSSISLQDFDTHVEISAIVPPAITSGTLGTRLIDGSVLRTVEGSDYIDTTQVLQTLITDEGAEVQDVRVRFLLKQALLDLISAKQPAFWAVAPLSTVFNFGTSQFEMRLDTGSLNPFWSAGKVEGSNLGIRSTAGRVPFTLSRGGGEPAGRFRIAFAQPHPAGTHYTILTTLETTNLGWTLVITETDTDFFRVEIFSDDGSWVNAIFHFVVLV
jgi:hypothetical protein